MKKKLIAAILTGAMLVAGMSTGVWAESEKSFVYGTTGYSEEMGDAGLNPHDNYSGWSALRYGVGETLFKYNDNMEVEPWLATDYEFVDDTTVKITLRDGVKFSSGRKPAVHCRSQICSGYLLFTVTFHFIFIEKCHIFPSFRCMRLPIADRMTQLLSVVDGFVYIIQNGCSGFNGNIWMEALS